MYTLRQIETRIDSKANGGQAQHERNVCLGREYSVINAVTSSEEFKKTFAHYWHKEYSEDSNTYCFVVSEGGMSIYPLIKGNLYFIMTENGKTFDNLTERY